MKYIIAILFGIVEGITEWLPISSTGHMILLNEFISLEKLTSPEFYSMFEVVIQLGAIMAIVVLYWKRIFPFKKNVSPRAKGIFKHVDLVIVDLWLKIIVACIPAVIVGLLFDDLIEKYFYNGYVVAFALIIFGLAFIFIEDSNARKKPKYKTVSQINGLTAAKIGLYQLLAAVFPGVSRSGATILGGLVNGVSRKAAAEFTFFLAVPVMFGASFLKLIKFGFAFSLSEFFVLLIGCLVAFITSLFVVRFMMSYIKKHDFKVFGWYRIILGLIVLAYFMIF